MVYLYIDMLISRKEDSLITDRMKNAVAKGMAFTLVATQLAYVALGTARKAIAEPLKSLPKIGERMTVGSDTKYKGTNMTQWTAQDGKTRSFVLMQPITPTKPQVVVAVRLKTLVN